MTDIPGGDADQLTLRHDALSLAFEALCRRLLANGGLRPDDLPAMRATALMFPTSLEKAQNTKLQVGGARLTEAVTALFDRLDGSDWRAVSNEDTWRSARLLVSEHGHDGAAAFAWERVRDLTTARDRLGVEVWCCILDVLDDLRRPA